MECRWEIPPCMPATCQLGGSIWKPFFPQRSRTVIAKGTPKIDWGHRISPRSRSKELAAFDQIVDGEVHLYGEPSA
jgi:hypothetical protein